MEQLKKLSGYSGPKFGVRAIFLSKEKRRPYANLPIIIAIEQNLGKNGTFLNIQGKLATNANGYVSFKIARDHLQRHKEIYIYPLGYEDLKMPMSDFVVATNGEGVQTIMISCEVAATIKRENIPSIQKADMLDHDFIPFFHRTGFRSSCQTFEENTQTQDPANTATGNADDTEKKPCKCHDPHYTEGKEPQALTCEALLPDTQPVECITVYQLDKDSTQTLELTSTAGSETLSLQTGTINLYESCFEPYGYSLGDLNYSVSLAPCESVNIAVENWFRKDRSVRSESTTRSEALENDVIRSKSVQEFIKSKLTEHKFNVGVSATLKVKGIPLGVTTGYAMGSRKSTTEMVQEINETHRQLSNSYSSYNSVAIYETTQSESRNTTTRHLRNHNHCHTLTLMYYEIVQNIKLTTIEQGHRDAVFIQYSTPCFTIKDVLAKRHILREVLLDQALIECLDSICLEEYTCDCSAEEIDDGTSGTGGSGETCPATVTKLFVSVRTADRTWAGSEGSLYFILEINGSNQKFYIPHTGDSKYRKNTTYTVEVPIPPTCIDDLTKVGLELRGSNKIILSNLSISYECQEDPGNQYFFFNQGLNDLELKKEEKMLDTAISPQYPDLAPPTDDQPTAIQELEAAKTCCENNLLQHLNCNKLYYYKIFWMLEDENERAIRFATYTYLGQSLLDAIENVPLGVIGDWVAFATIAPLSPATAPIQEETILYAPTGNVFSEAVLGQCGSCETIDNTVFWDWTDKQCPDSAPAITTGNLSQYQNAGLTPFNFANALLSQQALSNLTAGSSLAAITQAALGQNSSSIPKDVLANLIKLLEDSDNDSDEMKSLIDWLKKVLKLKSAMDALQGDEEEEGEEGGE